MTSQTRRPATLIATAVVVALLIAGAFVLWYLFFRPAEPAAVDSTAIPLPSLPAGASAAPLVGGIDGTWKVDTSIGSLAAGDGSFVGYRVVEQLASIGANTAVGRTPNVTGSMTVAGTRITDATIDADLTALQSNDQRRDGQLRQHGLETSQFPTATFKLSSPIDLGTVPTDGQEVSVTAKGQLTLHGVTKDVEIPLKAKLSGDIVAVTGTLPIVFADYGIVPPSSFVVLSIEDHGQMELQLFFTKS